MNTKYPINGRYTTLGDIIQEYGRYSALPDDKLDYWNHKITAPFVHFIYNDFPTDSQNAIRPYDIVWFDNVYSETEKENTGKRMKLIQRQDSSTYSFDRPITAKEVKTRNNIQKGAFEFRFIIPSTTSTDGKDRFYYNYKTASGESVVMYALRTIIDEAKKNIEDPDEKLKTFFIGDTDSDGFRTIQPSTEHKFTYRYKITDSNSSIIEGNGQYNKSVSGNDSYALYRIASEFDHKIPYNGSTYLFECPLISDTSIQTKTITDNDRTYTIEVEYLTWQGIDLPYEDTSVNDSKIKSQEKSGFPLFNFNKLPDNIFSSATELKNDAYQYLGDYYWTYKYVQLPNYASQSADDFEYSSCITDKDPLSCYEKISNSIGAQTKPSSEKLCSILFNPTNYTQIKDTKNAENQYYKCLYFLLLFLNSQRFFVSYITAFEYINISNKSYAQREPVLRCDLNLIKPIEYIKILSAQHFRETILPAGPLKPDTLISIIVYMKVKYKSIPNEKDFSTKINLTFEDLWNNKDITNTPDEEDIIGPWVTLINPFDHKWTEETKGVLTQTTDMDKYEGDRYGNDHFLQVNNNKLNTYSDCSLGTLMWPKGVQLQLATADALEIMRDNTSDEEWFASISDNSTYPDTYTRWDNFKEEKLSPFGYLRLHNYADINQKKESQFTVTVPLLRCNNWYYKQGASTSIDSAMIYSYFNNIYLNAQIAEPEPAIGMYVNTYAYGKQESNLQNILDKLNQLPIAAPSRIAQETISQIFGLKIGQAETLFFASGAKMIDEKTTADEKYNSSYTLYFEKLLSSKVWQRINPVSGAPENNCIKSRNADDKVVEQYEVSNDYRGQKGTYTLGRVYIDVDDTLLHNPKDNTKCFYFKITNADHNNEGKIQVSFLDYKDSASKASSGELKLGFTQSITASFVIYNYNKPDTLDNIGTDKPSNTLTINNSVTQGTKTTDITIINDEHNKFIMSELSTTETYRLTKHHDSDKKYLLHLFHYGVNSNNKLTVVFNNPEYMFRYQYPAIIDDTTKIISNVYSISLGDKFVTTTMSLTTDRTLYMSLNPIYAFLHVNESTEKKLSGEDDKDCPPFQFQQNGIGYTQTNGQSTSCLISTQTPGCVISLVTENVYITTDNILTGVNNIGSLSDYIKSQRERKQLLEIKINKYEFDKNDQVDLEGTQPNSTNIINTNTQPEFQIFKITKDTLTIFTYEVTKYRKDTSKDTFYVSIATAGWKGKSSNIKIYCVQEPPEIDGKPGKELGNPNNIQPSDDILQEITKMGQQFKNDTSVWICVPQQTLDLSSENTTNVCKHTQWDVDGKILSAQADGKISQKICISNKSITGVYLSYRTVYAIFETTESVTIPVQPEDTTITVSLTANPTIIEAKGGEFTLKYFVKKGNNPISDYGEPQPSDINFAKPIKISESINGEKSQTYKVDPNDKETPITCTYKLKYEDKERTTTITQKGSVYSAGITAETGTTSNIDPSGGEIVITYYGIKNGDHITDTKDVKLTCSDNSITIPDGQIKDNKLESTIKIPANTSDKQKTYKFTVTYTYLTDKKKEQKIELTQDRIEYVVHCGLDTEKYSATLVAKPESGKDIFEIIYFAEKGTNTNKQRIYDNTVTLESRENYDYLTLISDVPNSEKMYRVRTYQFTENLDVDPRDMEFKAKCGSNESEILYITQVGANTEVIPQFDFAIINYKIQNDLNTSETFNDITNSYNKDTESEFLSNINKIAGSDLDVWVTFSLDDNKSKALLLPVRTASNDEIHLNLYGALNSSTSSPYILGAGFSSLFIPCINNDNKTVYISTPERYSTATNESGNVCTNYIRYAQDNTSGSGYESIYVNVANILNEKYQNKTLLGHKCKNLYIDLWGVMYNQRSTGKVSIDFNMYNFKENVTDPKLTVNNYTFIPDSTKVDSVNKLNINDGYATGYSKGSHIPPTLISRITYPIRNGNPSIETKNLTYGNLNYCLLIPTDDGMKYVTNNVSDKIYYNDISNIKPYVLDLRTIYYQGYTLKNEDPNKKVLNPYKKLTGHNFTLSNASYKVQKDGADIDMNIENNVILRNNEFKLQFPILTEETCYKFLIQGITEPNVLNKASGLNDVKSYTIIVYLVSPHINIIHKIEGNGSITAPAAGEHNRDKSSWQITTQPGSNYKLVELKVNNSLVDITDPKFYIDDEKRTYTIFAKFEPV